MSRSISCNDLVAALKSVHIDSEISGPCQDLQSILGYNSIILI